MPDRYSAAEITTANHRDSPSNNKRGVHQSEWSEIQVEFSKQVLSILAEPKTRRSIKMDKNIKDAGDEEIIAWLKECRKTASLGGGSSG